MNLTEKETNILLKTLAIGHRHVIESNKMSRLTRDMILKDVPYAKTDEQREDMEEQVKSLDEGIEETIFSLNTVDRIIDSMEKRESIIYHNQLV